MMLADAIFYLPAVTPVAVMVALILVVAYIIYFRGMD